MAITNSSKGYIDFIIQRVSAIYMAVYILIFGTRIIYHYPLDFLLVQEMFASRVARVSTFIFVFAMLCHAWIGMWTIVTDYIKSAVLRNITHIIVGTCLISYLLWGIEIIWGRR